MVAKDDLGSTVGGSGGARAPKQRSHLLKATRRLGRTVRTEAKLFLARPTRRRPWTKPCLILLAIVATIYTLVWLFWPGELAWIDGQLSRESGHFTHNTRILPLGRQKAWEQAGLEPCSWLYFEVNAGDGRHTTNFFTNGNGFLEEVLRASQASMRGFCAVITEPDPQMSAPLSAIRAEKGGKARRFDVFAGIAASNSNGTEEVRLRDATNGGNVLDETEFEVVKNIPLASTLHSLTRPLSESGSDSKGMTIATGNRQNGTVVVRLNTPNLREAYWYLKMLDENNLLCNRVDRLIVNTEPMKFDPSRHYLIDRTVVRDFDGINNDDNNKKFDYRKGIDGLIAFATEVQKRSNCRTMMNVIDANGQHKFPPILSERSVFFAVLAGYPTFDERISAQTNSWMTGVPKDRVAIYTNVQRSKDELEAARGRNVHTVQPHRPELEGQLKMMQSWSHLVRVRETWDRYMKNDPSIQWLMLVDDDTFVFPAGLREYLTAFDPRVRAWGGSGEQARIDNGDGGQFAHWLRGLNTAHGGKHCYLPGEDIPEQFRGRRTTYSRSAVMNGRKVAHIISHMCSDAFCRRGCPAVPQGATIFLSRALVEALRPKVEECEKATSSLCKNCGSQRLYMCANQFVKDTRTYMTRGVCRATWRLEHRDTWPFALTYHGFEKYRRLSMSTKSIGGDMAELWRLGKSVEIAFNEGRLKSALVPMSRIADLIGCKGAGKYRNGKCYTEDGVEVEPAENDMEAREGDNAADRHGSA